LREVLLFKNSLIAAAIAYFTLFSMFPLLLLSVAIASNFFDPDPLLAGAEIIERMEFIVPGLGDLLGSNLEQIVRARGTVTGVSVLILIWSASSVFYVLTRALDNIWQSTAERRSVWKHRALAILLTIAVAILLWIASFAWSVIVPIINRLTPEGLITVTPIIGQLGSALASILLFSLLYYVLPHGRPDWRDVLTGAAIAGLLWEVAKRIFLQFATTSLTNTNLVYGSMAAIIAFLGWVYASSLILLYGAHVAVRYRQMRRDRQQSAEEM
jgi:membrane protein